MSEQDTLSEHSARPPILMPSEPLAPPPLTESEEVPACSVCGRQDETLRVVAYPYVFSLVVMTFRRAFAGLWCKKHRNLRLALASLITATIGWIGIPFGFLFTPVALFKLARGGHQPVELNVHLLKNLAEHKLKEGDPQGAIRCLEASLRFRDDETIRERLREVCTNFGLPVYQSGCQRTILTLAAVLLGAAGIGAIIGVLDYVITSILSSLIGGETLIYEVILSWTPFVAMAFIGGLALSQLIEWALARIRCCRLFLGLSIGTVTAVLTAYSLLQGSAISDYVATLLSGGMFESVVEAIFTSVLVLLLGGLFWIWGFIEVASTSEVIYIVLLLVIVTYYVIMAVLTAIRTTQWQQRLSTPTYAG